MPPYDLGVLIPPTVLAKLADERHARPKQHIRSSFIFRLDSHKIDDIVLIQVAQVGSKLFKKCQMPWFQCKAHRSIPISTDWLNYYKFRLYASSEHCPMLRVNDQSA